MPADLVRMLYVDPEHKLKTEEELEAIEQREKMEKIEGFKESRRRLNALQGKVTNEMTLDDQTRRYIEEEEKRLGQSFREFESSSRQTARELGQTHPPQEAQAEQQKEAVEQQRLDQEKATEQARFENTVEAPQGRQTGVSFKGKRKSSPRRGAPRSTQKLRSAETKAGSGIGG